MLRAYETSGLVHNMAYMMEPIAEAYGTLSIFFFSSSVLAHCSPLRMVPCAMGKSPLFESCIEKRRMTLSVYVL
ncbi:hypothetical protein HanIR_Chr15g0728981 [Helianthus annuus]|nr:hypothetical protein HanIR_Chr15g0728981 [Helianthus annuus]